VDREGGTTVVKKCVGCGEPLTKGTISREHILPKWLAQEVNLPNQTLKHYLHDEDSAGNELLRSHDLGSFAIKNICASCNNGWMSRLEGRAKVALLSLMNQQSSLLQLSLDERATISAWAIKTAFMIASAQQSKTDLPWDLFRQLAEEPERIPAECFVLAAQLPFLPEGFLYACPMDIMPRNQQPAHIRVGLTIRHLHFVVVIPLFAAYRVVRTSGVHIPIWPLNVEIGVVYKTFPTFERPGDLINFLTGLVEAGVASRL
jgi:hypothetical protein